MLDSTLDVKGRNNLGDLGVNGRIILKWLLKVTWSEDVDSVRLVHDKVQWRIFVNTVISLSFQRKVRIFLTNLVTIGFSKMTLLRESVDQSTNHLIRQSINQSINQSESQTIDKSISLSTSQLVRFVESPYHVRRCIQKFPNWPPGARTANGTALCN
jgi:Rps23 Pro-64 3,4-dihydroxylase Tpa1-like proline 4-hydroxylase